MKQKKSSWGMALMLTAIFSSIVGTMYFIRYAHAQTFFVYLPIIVKGPYEPIKKGRVAP